MRLDSRIEAHKNVPTSRSDRSLNDSGDIPELEDGVSENHRCSGSAIAIALRQSQPETPRVDETIANYSHARRYPIQSGIYPVFSPEYTCVFIPTYYQTGGPGLQARARM